jgi:hypothetical protein
MLSKDLSGWHQLPVNVDLSAIVVMEVLGAAAFFEASLFLRQFRRIKNKEREFSYALRIGAVSHRTDGKCFSSEWTIGNIVYKPKKLLSATPLVAAVFAVVAAVTYYVVIPTVAAYIIGFGYAILIALVGVAALLWTDAFEAYGYSDAIHDVAASQLANEDQSYMELAKTALKKASQRFFSLAVAFALLGPFIPLIFNGVLSLLQLG